MRWVSRHVARAARTKRVGMRAPATLGLSRRAVTRPSQAPYRLIVGSASGSPGGVGVPRRDVDAHGPDALEDALGHHRTGVPVPVPHPVVGDAGHEGPGLLDGED